MRQTELHLIEPERAVLSAFQGREAEAAFAPSRSVDRRPQPSRFRVMHPKSLHVTHKSSGAVSFRRLVRTEVEGFLLNENPRCHCAASTPPRHVYDVRFDLVPTRNLHDVTATVSACRGPVSTEFRYHLNNGPEMPKSGIPGSD